MTNSGDTVRPAAFLELVGSLTRYDLLLVGVPLVFLTAALVATSLSIPFEAAVFVASLVCAVALADALFVNPPVSQHGRS